MSKIQIAVIDFMSETGKYQIGEQDSSGCDLCVGDIVEYGSEKYMIVYRYGGFMLKQPHTAHTLGITNWDKTTKINEMWSTPDFVICGDSSEPFCKNFS